MAVITDRRRHVVEELGLIASVRDATDAPIHVIAIQRIDIRGSNNMQRLVCEQKRHTISRLASPINN
ncbi:MAG: hypothetical protein QNL56_02320 [Burkholderiales bacterium]|jgi:hypothetical protein